MAPRSLVAIVLCLGCASAAKPGTLYRKGVDAFESDDMQGAVTALQAFVDKTCPPTSTDKRCREACIKLGHAHERLGSPAGAWAAYDAALAFGPHTRDAMEPMLGLRGVKSAPFGPPRLVMILPAAL